MPRINPSDQPPTPHPPPPPASPLWQENEAQACFTRKQYGPGLVHVAHAVREHVRSDYRMAVASWKSSKAFGDSARGANRSFLPAEHEDALARRGADVAPLPSASGKADANLAPALPVHGTGLGSGSSSRPSAGVAPAPAPMPPVHIAV